MERRTNAPLAQQLAPIPADREIEFEHGAATLEVNSMDATHATTFADSQVDTATQEATLRQALSELHGSLAEQDISLSWYIVPPDRVRLVVAWTADVEPEPGVIYRQPCTYEYTLSMGDVTSLTLPVLLEDLER